MFRWCVCLLMVGCAATDPTDVELRITCRTHPVQQETTERCVHNCIEADSSDEMGIESSCLRVCQEIYCWDWPEFKKDGDWQLCRSGLGAPYHAACVNAGWKIDQ